MRAAIGVGSKEYSEALAISRVSQALCRHNRPGVRLRADVGGQGIFDWLYRCDDGPVVGLEVVRAVDEGTEQAIWGRGELAGSTAIAPEKLTEAISKKAARFDRYHEVLEKEALGTTAEMHLAIVDPWGGELFLAAFFDRLREIASKAPFEAITFGCSP